MSRRSRLLALMSAFILTAGSILFASAAPAAAQQTGGCVATYQVLSAWNGGAISGFSSQVTVKNVSTTTSRGWVVTLDFPDGYTVRLPGFRLPPLPGEPLAVGNEPWNGAIPPNGSTFFALTGTFTGGTLVPPITTCTMFF